MSTEDIKPADPGEPKVAPIVPEKPPEAKQESDTKWLNERIAQAKASAEQGLLKSLGVPSVDAAKAAIKAAQEKADAEKSAETRATELKAKADQLEAQSSSQLKVISEYAARQMIGLTAEQQAAVKAVAGDDPGQQLHAIQALAPTWAKAQEEQKVDLVSNTAPKPNAPPDGKQSAPNARDTYETMKRTNPFAAAAYAEANPDAYGSGQQKQ